MLAFTDYKPHDIFVIPNWTWTTLEADDDSILFSLSDRAALRGHRQDLRSSSACSSGVMAAIFSDEIASGMFSGL